MYLNYLTHFLSICLIFRERRRGVAAKLLNCDIILREFPLQLRYNDYFRTDTKGVKP